MSEQGKERESSAGPSKVSGSGSETPREDLETITEFTEELASRLGMRNYPKSVIQSALASDTAPTAEEETRLRHALHYAPNFPRDENLAAWSASIRQEIYESENCKFTEEQKALIEQRWGPLETAILAAPSASYGVLPGASVQGSNAAPSLTGGQVPDNQAPARGGGDSDYVSGSE